MSLPTSNGPEPTPSGVQIQGAPFTQDVEVISTPTGAVIHVRYRTASTHLHLFGSPEDWEIMARKLLEMCSVAGRAILLPPGTVMPMPERPEES